MKVDSDLFIGWKTSHYSAEMYSAMSSDISPINAYREPNINVPIVRATMAIFINVANDVLTSITP